MHFTWKTFTPVLCIFDWLIILYSWILGLVNEYLFSLSNLLLFNFGLILVLIDSYEDLYRLFVLHTINLPGTTDEN